MARVGRTSSPSKSRGVKEKIIVKKKIKSTVGKIELKKDHPYIKGMAHNFNISPLLQSHVLEFGYQLLFERAMKLLNTVLPIVNMGSSQSQRLMHHFGQLSEVEEALITKGFETEQCSKENKEVLYAQVDGGHMLTDDGYRETKVGRIFKGSDIKRISTDNEGVELRNKLEQSDYLANLGYYQSFTKRFDQLIKSHFKKDKYTLVLISDGAEWIANWQLEKYPSAIMILDFYHALEHLGVYAKMIFNSAENKEHWIAKRKEELLNGELNKVITAIQKKSLGRRAAIQEKAKTLITYYEKNRFRMKYDQYLKQGYCIGSRAIESAISTVVQQRCKLVGQRWTKRVKAVLNIRALCMNNKKEKLLKIINTQMGHLIAA
ncbi:MAG: hypothetical protein ACI9CQ_004601 [Saprospiraceae bacterium]|jgi:hypothetical protein